MRERRNACGGASFLSIRRWLLQGTLSIGASVPLFGAAQPPAVERSRATTTIEIVLDPDGTMIEQAQAANARLRGIFPGGFALDATHQPTIACLRRRVRTGDLDKALEAIGKVVVEERPGAWRLKAFAYDYLPEQDPGLMTFAIEQTGNVMHFQERLVDVLVPFTEKSRSEVAVGTVGELFEPSVPVGVARQNDLREMIGEKFEAFTFAPAGLTVYELAERSMTPKRLKRWEFVP